MKFKIEQVAIKPANAKIAKLFLEEIGIIGWAEDHVVAHGEVWGQEGMNEANLSFNYDIIEGKEFEVLEYTDGPNWLWNELSCVSHLGMHCTEEELEEWKGYFKHRGIRIAQEVWTKSHTNPEIKDRRKYNYVIFDTRQILGVDLKFIVRKNIGAKGSNVDGFAEAAKQKSWPENG